MSLSEQDEQDGMPAQTDELRTRLSDIEGEPLDARAPAYAHLHDALQAQLEGADSEASHG